MGGRIKRVLMTVFGVMIAGMAVGIFNLAGFGVDPFQSFAQGLWGLTGIGYGIFYTILNIALLLLVFFVDKRKIGLGTVINIFLLGYVVEGSTAFLVWIFKEPGLMLRVIFLIVGIVVLCFGSSLYFVADMGVSTYDAVALIMTEKGLARFFICRIGTDVFCVIVGIICGAKVGVATLMTAFFMGPIIALFNRLISYPLLYGKDWKRLLMEKEDKKISTL